MNHPRLVCGGGKPKRPGQDSQYPTNSAKAKSTSYAIQNRVKKKTNLRNKMLTLERGVGNKTKWPFKKKKGETLNGARSAAFQRPAALAAMLSRSNCIERW